MAAYGPKNDVLAFSGEKNMDQLYRLLELDSCLQIMSEMWGVTIIQVILNIIRRNMVDLRMLCCDFHFGRVGYALDFRLGSLGLAPALANSKQLTANSHFNFK